MTPSEELEMEELEKFRQFKKEQRQKYLDNKAKARERIKQRRESMKLMRVLASQVKIPEKSKERILSQIKTDIEKEKYEKKEKVQFEGKSLLDIMHSVER